MIPAIALPASAAELAAEVTEPELLRLLGLPRGRTLEGDLKERAERARGWYGAHGRPFVASRRMGVQEIAPSLVRLEDGAELRSAALAERLQGGAAHALLALAASAGREAADEVARLWAAERPDEAYFLDRFAAAVTERLVFWAQGVVCRASEPAGETLLPHLSPGCGHFDLADQHRVMALLTGLSPLDEEAARLGPIALLASGALDPPHSVLAVLGVTRGRVEAAPQDLCRACDLDPCSFRRAAFAGKSRPVLEAP